MMMHIFGSKHVIQARCIRVIYKYKYNWTKPLYWESCSVSFFKKLRVRGVIIGKPYSKNPFLDVFKHLIIELTRKMSYERTISEVTYGESIFM